MDLDYDVEYDYGTFVFALFRKALHVNSSETKLQLS